MCYTVTEIQKNGEAISTTSTGYENRETAFEKFFQVATYIPKSALDIHTVTIVNEDGNPIASPISKKIINA